MPEISNEPLIEGYVDAKAEEEKEALAATQELFEAAQQSEKRASELFSALSQRDSRGRFKAWGNDEFSREKREEWVFEKDRLNMLEGVKEKIFLSESAPKNKEEIERAKIDVLKEKIAQLCITKSKFSPEAMLVLGQDALAKAFSELSQGWYPEEKDKDELREAIASEESKLGGFGKKIGEKFNRLFGKNKPSRYERLVEMSKRFGWPSKASSPENK